MLESRKAQSGIELVMYISFTLLFFSVFYMTIIQHDIETILEQRSRQFQKITDTIAYELDIAKSIGPGYSRNFTIPTNVLGETYTVVIINNMVVVRASQDYARTTTVENIVGTIAPGFNSLDNNNGIIDANIP